MLQAAWLKNHGVRNTRETSLAKWHACDVSMQSALDAVQNQVDTLTGQLAIDTAAIEGAWVMLGSFTMYQIMKDPRTTPAVAAAAMHFAAVWTIAT